MEKERGFDVEIVMVLGLSTGNYYAVRIAHTHKQRVRGVVAQGAGTHEFFFGGEWIEMANWHEYSFS
jgi:pimeloyl-ACP methyl ester carboxylesterase